MWNGQKKQNDDKDKITGGVRFFESRSSFIAKASKRELQTEKSLFGKVMYQETVPGISQTVLPEDVAG